LRHQGRRRRQTTFGTAGSRGLMLPGPHSFALSAASQHQ
jgi:hypothetical protein